MLPKMKAGKIVVEVVCLYSPQLCHGRRHRGLVPAVGLREVTNQYL